ncbi:hypothetical protein ACFY0R_35135 [Streptomyces sp. NPDC001633]|uniref:hypothetical protein n=1 Tax=Streptomyces sp. NPDC001633 TaxID=3364595 RepID=UPI00369A1F4C
MGSVGRRRGPSERHLPGRRGSARPRPAPPGPARLGPGGGWSWFVEAGWAMHADGVGWRVTQQVVQ